MWIRCTRMHARTYGLRAPAARTGRAAGVAGPVLNLVLDLEIY